MAEWQQTKPSIIVQSAVKLGKYVIPGIRHFDHLMIDIIHIIDERENWLPYQKESLGYLDQFGNFFSEAEAIQKALEANQIQMPNMRMPLHQQLWSQKEDRRVVCAALRYKEYVFTAPRHFHPVHHAWFLTLPEGGYWRNFPKTDIEQGFVDQDGVYMDRFEALIVARRANQLVGRIKTSPQDRLFSEDIY